jgi:hypothetical protein
MPRPWLRPVAYQSLAAFLAAGLPAGLLTPPPCAAARPDGPTRCVCTCACCCQGKAAHAEGHAGCCCQAAEASDRTTSCRPADAPPPCCPAGCPRCCPVKAPCCVPPAALAWVPAAGLDSVLSETSPPAPSAPPGEFFQPPRA